MLHNTKLEVLNVLKQESYVYKQGSMAYWIIQSPSGLKVVGSIPFLASQAFFYYFFYQNETNSEEKCDNERVCVLTE